MDSDFSVLAAKIRILTAPNESYCEVFTWQEKKEQQNKTKPGWGIVLYSWTGIWEPCECPVNTLHSSYSNFFYPFFFNTSLKILGFIYYYPFSLLLFFNIGFYVLLKTLIEELQQYRL